MSGSAPVRLGLRENAAQFGLLVAINAFVGAMVGLERSTLPLIGRDDFDLGSSAAVLSFIVAFGLAKSFTNLGAGALAERAGRRRLLLLGWAFALPVPLLIAVAPSWGWIVAANVLLGVNQGLAWSMTVLMKIDLVGPKRRGLALGLNESAGYGGVAVAAAISGWLAADLAARDVLVVGGAAVAIVALLLSALFVRDTGRHVELEQEQDQEVGESGGRAPTLRSCSQAGLVNNMNDALAWGIVPLFLAAGGASAGQIGLVAGLYPAVWGVGQIWTGHWSDRFGRKPLIVGGMLLQAGALALMAASDAAVGPAAAAAVLLGAGTALVYPTLIAAISDAVSPVARAPAVGVYRFWRDMGYVAGGLLAGVVADTLDLPAAIAVIAGVTAASGIWVALDMPGRVRGPMPQSTEKVRHPIFARLCVREGARAEKKGQGLHREELLAGLSGRVVEVGTGPGLNFSRYPGSVAEVVAVEPESHLRKLAEEAAAEAPVPIRVVDGLADALPFDDGSFDAGVVSLVLCTVPDQQASLAELHRVIRPGGELRFYEHVISRKPGLARVQRVADRTGITPLVGGGCHAARDTGPAIEAAGFRIQSCRRFDFHASPFEKVVEPRILGVARRP